VNSTAVTGLAVTKLTFARKIFINNSYTEFNENPPNGLVADIMSQTDRRAEGA